MKEKRFELLPLSAACALANYGFAWDGTLGDFVNRPITGLLKDKPQPDHGSVWGKFEQDLSSAGYAGEVRFRRAIEGTAIGVPQEHFIRTRGFWLHDNTIAALPRYAEGGGLTRDRDRDIPDVSVDRESFEHWLYQTYPHIKPGPDSPEKAFKELLKKWRDDPVRLPGNKDECFRFAKDSIPGLRRDVFRTLWEFDKNSHNGTPLIRRGAPSKKSAINPAKKN
jgi:hypothetical protein